MPIYRVHKSLIWPCRLGPCVSISQSKSSALKQPGQRTCSHLIHLTMIGLDWRAPGYSWSKTEFGWRTRWRTTQQRSRPEAAAINISNNLSDQINAWRNQLELRCITVTQCSSRENSNYVTIGAAITELNFLCAVKDQNCFAYICEVILELFSTHWWSLSRSTQNLAIKIIEVIKNDAIENKTNYAKALELITTSVKVLQKGNTRTTFVWQNKIDTDIVKLQKWKEQLHISLHDISDDSRQGGLLDLPSVVLHHLISYLIDPQDLLNFGLTHPLLQEMTEVPAVWYNLCVLHCKETSSMYAMPKLNWKKHFIVLYKKHSSTITSDVLHVCTTCNNLFWKSYGHPCTTLPGRQFGQQQQQYKIISPKQFIEILYF